MSEQEKKSGIKAGGTPVMVVEHKPPYRLTDLEDEASEPPHRRSRAPAVPSVAEEIKASEETNIIDVERMKERKENEAPEKYKQNVAKKLSSNTKKREPPTETITMAPLEVDARKSGAPQPIPPEVSSLSSMLQDAGKTPSKSLLDARADEDSIVDEVAELRTADAVAKHSEWEDKELIEDRLAKKKEISWNDPDYLNKVPLKEMGTVSRAIILERKASVGPCKLRTPFEAPSGLMLCVPKKSKRNLQESNTNDKGPVINIAISKKFLSRCKSGIEIKKSSSVFKGDDDDNDEKRAVKVDIEIPYIRILFIVKSRINILRDRIQNMLNL